MKIPILFKSSEFIAVNKPTGISVHNNEDRENLLKQLADDYPQLYPVHRLDKETSGVQILALNEKSAAHLALQFQSREVEKKYVGVLRGLLKEKSGIWNKSLSDKAEGRNNPQGQAKDRIACETKFKIIQQSKYFTLCEFDLITGRQHQIRKHAALTNHPLVGDPRYGDPKYNKKIAEVYNSGRMFLHCQSVTILGQKIESELPTEFSLDFAKKYDL